MKLEMEMGLGIWSLAVRDGSGVRGMKTGL